MIIARTPFRISFFGGGTDYPVFYKEHGGAVLSTTINKYCYVTCRYLPPFFDHKFRIRYTKREETQTIDEIVHPSVRECLRYMEIERDKGVEIVHTSDIPAMSGIGSSSSFTVCLLNALYALKGKVVTKRSLALDAIHVEQNMIMEPVGSQDQTAAAFGGFNRIEFGGKKDGIFVQTIPINGEKLKYLQSCLLFYFAGFPRYASDISKEQIEQTPKKVNELNLMKEMVDEAINILNGPVELFNEFGKLLHESWILKRTLTKLISNSSIDDIYETAMKSGATGGKLCGAGGGGFMLLFVPPEKQDKVKDSLKDLLLVPFRFENLGSHVIFYSTT
jgi:D-glycero-alpha-D-manno-heptose-7-phosphate kinase